MLGEERGGDDQQDSTHARPGFIAFECQTRKTGTPLLEVHRPTGQAQ